MGLQDAVDLVDPVSQKYAEQEIKQERQEREPPGVASYDGPGASRGVRKPVRHGR